MEFPSPSFVFALALGSGVVAQSIAKHLRFPSIVVLLAMGVLLGPDGFGWVVPDVFGDGLFGLVSLAVAVILFEGGLCLDLNRLRHEGSAIRMLISAGALITGAGGALAAHWILDWSWPISLLFGSLVIVTGPTVIRPILRNFSLTPRVATVLEAEGLLIDPVGAVLAAVTLQIVLAPESGIFASGMVGLVERLGFGVLAGVAAGFALVALFRWERIIPEELENIFTLGVVLAFFEVCEHVVSESGILAVTVAGIVLGNSGAKVCRDLKDFEEVLTVGLIGMLFVILAADVRLGAVVDLGWAGLATVGALMFLVRPVNIFVSTIPSELRFREKLFLAWMAPRGIVAAAVASLVAGYMDVAGMPGGDELRAMVFLTIAVTVVVQGGLCGVVAGWLGVRGPERNGILILGADALGLELGKELRGEEQPVVFFDTNPTNCRMAEEADFPVVFGNALEERTFVRSRPEHAQAAIGLTANEVVNSLFAREAKYVFGVRDVFVALTRVDGDITADFVERGEGRTLFDGPKDVERWNVRLRHGSARVEYYQFIGSEERAEQREEKLESWAKDEKGDPFVMLSVRREGRDFPMYAGFRPKAEDVTAVVIEQSQAHVARCELLRAGWMLVDYP